MATPPPRYSDEATSHIPIEIDQLMAKADVEEGSWEDKTAAAVALSKDGDDEADSDVPLDDYEPEPAKPVATLTLKEKIFGYVILVVALLGVSSMGMVALMVEGVPPTLVGSWRAQSTAMLMIPCFAYQLGQMLRAGTARSVISWNFAKFLMYGAIGGALWGGLFFLALNYTSLAHAYLFDNLLCIVVVGYKLIRRQPTSWLELTGTGLGVAGAALALVGGADDGVEREMKWVVVGDLICIVGCFGGLLYLYAGKQLRETIPLFVYMFPLSIISALVYYVLSISIEGTDAGMGFFDWLTPQYIGVTMYLGTVTGFLGYVGYIACLKYVPAIVVTVVMLLEPILGAAMGVIFGVTGMLDVWTIVGGIVLLIGTILVTYASFQKESSAPPGQQGKLKRGASVLLHRMGNSSLKLFAPFTPRRSRRSREADYAPVVMHMKELSEDDAVPVQLYSAPTDEGRSADDAV